MLKMSYHTNMKLTQQTHKRAKGNKGEDIACVFLEKNGYKVVDRNYLKKYGEIDIVAISNGIIHFFEVKSITSLVPQNDSHRPEDNVHGLKTKRLRRMVETYLEEKGGGLNREFYFHILCVYLSIKNSSARVKWIKNVIL